MERSAIISKIEENGFPEQFSQPIDDLTILTGSQKIFFHRAYEAHHFFCDNRYNSHANDYFKIVKAYIYICVLDKYLVKIPFVQKYAMFYGVIADEFGLFHLFNDKYECSRCGAILNSQHFCPYCK